MQKIKRYSLVSRSGAIALATLVLSLVCAPCGGTKAQPVGIRVEANPNKPLWLRVTVRSFATTRVTIYRESLPWGREGSIILAAVTPGGHHLNRFQFIDDPTMQEVSLDPGASLDGEINLADKFDGLDEAVKKSDVHIFWAYNAPEELHIARWSGGWLLIPQQK